VWAAIEYQVGPELPRSKQTLPNQLKKEVANPTARWLFALMAGVYMLYFNDNQMVIVI
jgi:hypothetical protein